MSEPVRREIFGTEAPEPVMLRLLPQLAIFFLLLP